jgi:hypothetical protein
MRTNTAWLGSCPGNALWSHRPSICGKVKDRWSRERSTRVFVDAVLSVLDFSGSMSWGIDPEQTVESDERRIGIAKAAIATALDEGTPITGWPNTVELGFWPVCWWDATCWMEEAVVRSAFAGSRVGWVVDEGVPILVGRRGDRWGGSEWFVLDLLEAMPVFLNPSLPIRSSSLCHQPDAIDPPVHSIGRSNRQPRLGNHPALGVVVLGCAADD